MHHRQRQRQRRDMQRISRHEGRLRRRRRDRRGTRQHKDPEDPRKSRGAHRTPPQRRRSSVGQRIVGDTATDVVEEWSDESDTIAHRIRAVRGSERTPEPNRQMTREETRRTMQARKAEDKKILDGLRRRYKRQAAENEADLMARIWETERAQVVRLSTRWVENVANVCTPSGAQRNRQLQSSKAALDDLRERR